MPHEQEPHAPRDRRHGDERSRDKVNENEERQPKKGPRVDPDDEVEEASWESFPASDPPSFSPGKA